MKLKRQEFLRLQQRNLSVTEYLHKFMKLSRYAPYEVDNDEKKLDAFLRGLDPELKTLIGVGVYPDFNTMVNRAITTAKNKQDETRDRKRKFKVKRTYPQEKTMKLQQPTFSRQKSYSLLLGFHSVIQATCCSYKDTGIFPTATDRRQPSDQSKGMFQLQRD
jgi:hypothetical protein